MALAHAHLGLTLQREGRLVDAFQWFEQALALQPNNADFNKLLGELHLEWGEPAEAIPLLTRAGIDVGRSARATPIPWRCDVGGRKTDGSR